MNQSTIHKSKSNNKHCHFSNMKLNTKSNQMHSLVTKKVKSKLKFLFIFKKN